MIYFPELGQLWVSKEKFYVKSELEEVKICMPGTIFLIVEMNALADMYGSVFAVKILLEQELSGLGTGWTPVVWNRVFGKVQ